MNEMTFKLMAFNSGPRRVENSLKHFTIYRISFFFLSKVDRYLVSIKWEIASEMLKFKFKFIKTFFSKYLQMFKLTKLIS